MDSAWAFLASWLSVLKEFLLPESKPRGLDWEVMLWFKCSYESEKRLRMHDLSMKLSLNEACRQDRAKLQRLREAIELFTMLAFVDNEAFRELLHADTWFHDFIQPYARGEEKFYPEWLLYLVETPSPEDIAANQTPISWERCLIPRRPAGELAGISDSNTRVGSHGCRRICKGAQQSVRFHVDDWTLWPYRSRGTQTSILPADSPNPFSTQVRNLLDGLVPPVVQMRAVRHSYAIVQQVDPPHSNLKVVLTLPGKNMDIPERTICERTLSLARTPTTKFTLGLDRGTSRPKLRWMWASS